MKRSLIALAIAAVALLGIASPASAAHFGNNKAELTGTAPDSAITGTATVNYSEGRGTFNGTTRVSGLEPNTEYTFRVNGAPDGQKICTFTTDANGAGGCSEQGLMLDGFGKAQIVNETTNVVVASGDFARRGNCRDRDQAGSQCEANDAPGRNK
jgi:hypothetical protein